MLKGSCHPVLTGLYTFCRMTKCQKPPVRLHAAAYRAFKCRNPAYRLCRNFDHEMIEIPTVSLEFLHCSPDPNP